MAGLILAVADLLIMSIIHNVKLTVFVFGASAMVLCALALAFSVIGVFRRPRFYALIGLGLSVVDLSLVLAALGKILDAISRLSEFLSRFGHGYA